MNLLEKLKDKEIWYSFLNYKLEKGTLFFDEEKELRDFIDNEKYIDKVEKLCKGEYSFSLPEKLMVNKMGSTKKRVVYTFSQDENLILKLMAYLLHRYDSLFAPNLYSFRQNYSTKEALATLTRQTGVYCYKVDIHNYFNSIDTNILLEKLTSVIDDEHLLWFFRSILTQEKCIYNGQEVSEKMGGMAGTPISAFFANIYLMEMDKYFYENNVVYARYSDDIVIFSKDKEELDGYVDILHKYIFDNKLEINSDKEHYYEPSEAWEFLGVSCHNREVDLSSGTIQKIKGKIRRKCRALYRWKIRKGATTDNAVRATIKVFNRKFYGIDKTTELTWSRWFFPIITTDKSLKLIDNFLEENLRYIATGRHTKKNYKEVTYRKLKDLGFTPLVSAFWEYRKSIEK